MLIMLKNSPFKAVFQCFFNKFNLGISKAGCNLKTKNHIENLVALISLSY